MFEDERIFELNADDLIQPEDNPAIEKQTGPVIGVPDRLLLSLNDRLMLTSDDELQWIVYHYCGNRWRPHSFHAMKESLLQRYRSTMNETAMKQINSWPDTFKEWLRLGH